MAARTNFYRRKDSIEAKYDVNEEIRDKTLLLIDDEGENLGEKDTKEALALAKERELDLVVIAKEANPPVAKIVDWSKFKYDQKKKKKKSSSNKGPEQKEMWFKAFIGEGDIEHKMKKVKEFIEDGHNVKITVKRKRHVSKQQLDELMNKLLGMTEGYAKVITPPKLGGPNYSANIGPK